MDYRQTIREAWEFTQNNKKLTIWYAFFPAVFTTLAGIIYLTYQFFAFKSSPLFENWDHSFGYVLVTTIFQIIRENLSSSIPLLIIGVVILLLYLFIPALCEGAIIQLIARRKNGQNVRTRDGLKYGMLSFLPIFEYSSLIKTFSVFSILGEGAFVARNLGMDLFNALLPVMIIFIIAGLFLTLLFTYTEFFIVIDDGKVFDSIVKSSTLVIKHLEATLLLSVLMLIISIRIILQLLFVVLIPAIIMVPVYLFASSTIPEIGFFIGGILGLVALYFASYLSATIHVFAASVWTFTFLQLTKEEEISARAKGEN